MELIKVGQVIPDCVLVTTNQRYHNLHELRSQFLILYFYPKDCTSVCTLEGQNFRDLYRQFKKYHTEILGVSRDSLKLHEKFKQQQAFPFELVSDQDESLCQLFSVIKQKNMYGKKVRGIERSTFLIDPKGILLHEWRKVKVPGHADEVLNVVKSLQG